MLIFCFFSRQLLPPILGQSRLIAPSYQKWKPLTILKTVTIICIILINCHFIILLSRMVELAGSRILYELDHRKPILYVIPIKNITGKLCVVSVGHTGTIQHSLHTAFPLAGAPGNRKLGSGNGCTMWFVNSWAMGWSLDLQWNQTGVGHIAMLWKVPFKNACIIFIIFIIFVIWFTITNNDK